MLARKSLRLGRSRYITYNIFVTGCTAIPVGINIAALGNAEKLSGTFVTLTRAKLSYI